MRIEDIHQRLVSKFGDAIIAIKTDTKDPWIEVASGSIADVCSSLRSDPEFDFDSLNDLTGSDWLETDAKKKSPCEPHVEVVYHLYSFSHKHRLKIKAKLPRWKNGQTGELPEIPTVSHIWAVADWHEREAYDLVGIVFLGHPYLKRILCPEDWEGHALRKDYEFPLEYHGVRGK